VHYQEFSFSLDFIVLILYYYLHQIYAKILHYFTTPSSVLKCIQAALEAINVIIFRAPRAEQSYANVGFMPLVALL
jgi:hypothetical protein